MSFEKNIKDLGILIPFISKPIASYEPGIILNDIIYISGQLPMEKGILKYKGIVGKDISVEEAYEASKICVINSLGIIKNMLSSIEKVEQIIQVQGFVNCYNDFTDHPKVINGASDILVKIFGEKGKHSRFAVGVSGLPLGSSVEVGMIIKIKK